MSHHFILDAIQSVSPERLQRAICSLASNDYHLYVTQCGAGSVAGTVMNGDGKEYTVSIGDGYMSCACLDFSYRGVRVFGTAARHACRVRLYPRRGGDRLSPHREGPGGP